MSNNTHHIDSIDSHPNPHQRGFTLLEVLITVVILSIGILGLAGLQFNTLRSNQNAAQSTIAVLQLIDAADRLRGNITGVVNGNYNNLPSGGTDPGCISTGCSAAKLAQYDAWSWNQQITASGLPDGQGVICLDSTPNDGTSKDKNNNGCDDPAKVGQRIFFAAKIWWDDDRNPKTPHRRHTISITP